MVNAPMNEQADGGAKPDLACLLNDILADLESALNSARNKPAKRLLQERIDRLRSAIDMIKASEQPSRDTPDGKGAERRYGT